MDSFVVTDAPCRLSVASEAGCAYLAALNTPECFCPTGIVLKNKGTVLKFSNAAHGGSCTDKDLWTVGMLNRVTVKITL